jgi:hypothetical protein
MTLSDKQFQNKKLKYRITTNKYRFGGSTANQICAYKMIENVSRLAYLTAPSTKKRSSSHFHVLKDCEIHDNEEKKQGMHHVLFQVSIIPGAIYPTVPTIPVV